MGTPEDQTTAFPPHKIIANIYYVGTKTLSSFLKYGIHKRSPRGFSNAHLFSGHVH